MSELRRLNLLAEINIGWLSKDVDSEGNFKPLRLAVLASQVSRKNPVLTFDTKLIFASRWSNSSETAD